MRLYIVRHGQTAWNLEGRAQGHTDIPLDLRGEGQAASLAERFAGADVKRVMSSDLIRCRRTAEPTASALGLELEVRTDLRERSFGDWEGRSFRDLAITSAAHPTDIRPPGGESFDDVWVRVGPVCDELRETDDNTIVFTHGGTGGVILARLLHGTVLTSKAFRFDNTGVTTLERRKADGLFMITRYNDASHAEQSGSVAVKSL